MKQVLHAGDVVNVSMNDGAFTYRGVVTCATARSVYVNTRSSGALYRRGTPGVVITLVERCGQKFARDGHDPIPQFQ